MSVQVENLEKNMAKLTIEVSAEEFEKAVHTAKALWKPRMFCTALPWKNPVFLNYYLSN